MRGLILLCLLMCSGCATKSVHTKWEQPKLEISATKPMDLSSVKFVVITSDNALIVLEEMKSTGEEPILIALTPEDYKNLSINIQLIKNYLLEQKKIVKLYKEFYEQKEGK